MSTPGKRPPRVLLTTLAIRTSARGTDYLQGWLGRAKLVGFKGEPDKYSNATWSIFAVEPEPRPEQPGEAPS